MARCIAGKGLHSRLDYLCKVLSSRRLTANCCQQTAAEAGFQRRHDLLRNCCFAPTTCSCWTPVATRSQLLRGRARATPCSGMSYVREQRADEEVVWLQEEISEDIKWLITVKKVLHSGQSSFQSVELVESGPFKKLLLLDGKAQSAEADEFVYHECLVHPAMLLHPNPKKVFICGGGEGATAREVLRHKSVEQCVMVDIDKVVCDFCAEHLAANQDAFADKRLELIIDDARKQLEDYAGTFDVIIGDLADPVFGGPCYQLYTQEFYRTVVKRKLADGGIFVTQSGPAGVLSCTEVFTPIASTLRSVFPSVLSYVAHVPSFVDAWGWNLAATDASAQLPSDASSIDDLITSRINGSLKFLDGATVKGIFAMNKTVREALQLEQHIYTVDQPRYLHGTGVRTLV